MDKKILMGMFAVMAFSGIVRAAEDAKSESIYDRIWSYGTFIDNDDAKVVQKLALTGRLQGDAYSFHGDDSNYEDLKWRRFRFGFKADVFQDFFMQVEADFNLNDLEDYDWDTFYVRLTDAYAGWSPSKKAKVKVGKQSAGFTLDGATSSKNLLTPERSVVAGNIWFPTEYFSGAQINGDLDKFSYKAGVFSASGEQEFGHFDSGYFTLLSAGIKVGENGSLRLDYVYNDPNYAALAEYGQLGVGTKNLEQVLALVYKQMITKKLGVWADIAGGKGISDSAYGIDQGDLLGVDIMPFYNFTENFQLVAQYAGVTSLDNTADVGMARYAGKNTGTKVESTQTALLGFNWYIYGQKLKWQNAVEYNFGKNLATTGEDYHGYGLTSAIRISW
jgi:phosphate-selective porin OprO/OprP